MFSQGEVSCFSSGVLSRWFQKVKAALEKERAGIGRREQVAGWNVKALGSSLALVLLPVQPAA